MAFVSKKNVVIAALLSTITAPAFAEQLSCSIETDSAYFKVAYDSSTGNITEEHDSENYFMPNEQVVVAKKPTIERKVVDGRQKFTFIVGGKTLMTFDKSNSNDSYGSDATNLVYKGQKSNYCSLSDMLLQPVAHSKGQLCAMSKDLGSFQNLLMAPENRLSFANGGGLINGGVCWWHSRFERNAAYLAVFRPELKAPSVSAARVLIAQLRSGKKVVEIPGFANLYDFSVAFQKEIQTALEDWQMSDGVFGGGWLNGMSGSTSTTAAAFKKIMDDTYANVSKSKRIAFQMLQVPGVTAHAWLVIGMQKTKDGYTMLVADSNFPGRAYEVPYTYGMKKMNYPMFGDMVPYLTASHMKEGEALIKTLKSACGK